MAQTRGLSPQRPVAFVVDDDPDMRQVLDHLLQSVDIDVLAFESAEEFLSAARPDGPCCMVLDVRLPGMSGFELQEVLAAEDVRIPIVFITGHGNSRMAVRAMKAGAVDFLTKPIRDEEVLDAVQSAIALDRDLRQEQEELAELRTRYNSLTTRERQVFLLVTQGFPNKEVGHSLAIGEATVKLHRSRLMRKMGAESLAMLVLVAAKLGFSPDKALRLGVGR